MLRKQVSYFWILKFVFVFPFSNFTYVDISANNFRRILCPLLYSKCTTNHRANSATLCQDIQALDSQATQWELCNSHKCTSSIQCNKCSQCSRCNRCHSMANQLCRTSTHSSRCRSRAISSLPCSKGTSNQLRTRATILSSSIAWASSP